MSGIYGFLEKHSPLESFHWELTLLVRWRALSSPAAVSCLQTSFWQSKCPAIPSDTTKTEDLFCTMVSLRWMHGFMTHLSFFDACIDRVQQVSSVLVTFWKFYQFFPDQLPTVVTHHPLKRWVHILKTCQRSKVGFIYSEYSVHFLLTLMLFIILQSKFTVYYQLLSNFSLFNVENADVTLVWMLWILNACSSQDVFF